MLKIILFGGLPAKIGPPLLQERTNQVPGKQSLVLTFLEQMDDDN